MLLIVFAVVLFQTCQMTLTHQNKAKSLLISYDGYYNTPTRRAILETAQSQLYGQYSIEERNNFFSDFDVIHGYFLESCRFLAHERIIKVFEDYVQHFRQPLAMPIDLKTSKHLDIRQITDLLRADRLWAKGFTGRDIDVAVFDTGLTQRRAFFRNVKNVRDFTSDGSPTDKIGHGTFVAGLIASSRKSCSGIAPRANLHIFKVFTANQVSSTAWFLDAFNAALQANVNIINLSIGGPDFTDQPFMDKIREVTAAGIIIVSAIGNDGPVYGTLNNPADQGDVIGVGGINIEGHVSRFSSRGMTTWELPNGYGRVKPDVVAYGVQVFGAAINGGCRMLSGTSVATPVVTGALALILSSVPLEKRRNIAMIKQILIEGAKRLNTPVNIFEQGAGRLDLPASFYHIQKYTPKISIFPAYIDYLECPYMWPWCSQPIYHTGLPIIFNLTVYNGFGINGQILESPIFEALESDYGHLLNVTFEYSNRIWPWSGFLAVFVKIKPNGADFTGTASGQVRITVKTEEKVGVAVFQMRLKVVSVPKISQRLLWDQFRSMRYPPGYFARDDLSQKHSPLDWTGDHPHTTFKLLYDYLRSRNYFIEVLCEPISCLVESDPEALTRYGAYIVVDPEEEYFPSELNLLEEAAKTNGLSILAFGDWFNATLIEKIQFFDENTRQYWMPETGGCNIPALNALLQRFGFAFGDFIVDGHVANIGGNVIQIRSGSSLIEAPHGALLGYARLKDQGAEMVFNLPNVFTNAPVFGLNVITHSHANTIFAVFSDSSCLETPNSGCFALFNQLLASVEAGFIVPDLLEGLVSTGLPVHSVLPTRIVKSNFANYSQVVFGFDKASNPLFRKLPRCRTWKDVPTTLIKKFNFPADMFTERNSLDVIEIERILGPRLSSNFDLLLDNNAEGLSSEDDAGLDEFELPVVLYYCFWIFVVIIMLTGAFTARPRFVQIIVTKTLRAFLRICDRI